MLASAVLLILGHLTTARYTEGTLLLMLSKSQHKTESGTEWQNKAAWKKKKLLTEDNTGVQLLVLIPGHLTTR